MPLRWALRNLSSKTRFYGEIADGYLGFLLARRSYTSFSGEKPLKFSPGSPAASKVFGGRGSYCYGSHAYHDVRYQIHQERSSVVEEPLDPFSLVADELSTLANRLRSMVVAEVLLLMASALNMPIPESAAESVLHGMLKETRARQQCIAEITEMIHVASLLHDDVLDDADTRRGIGSLNFVMGNKISVLAGDFLLSRACVALASLKNTEVVSLLATVVEHLVTGETMQMTTTSDQRCSMEYYLQKTYYKTASLISNSCKAIALLAGQTAEVSMLAYDYGRNLGLAYQLIDDVLDFTGTSASLGKGSLSDIRHGIITAPVLFAIEEFPQIRGLVDRGFDNPSDIDLALDYLGKSQGIQRTKELASKHATLAAAAIDSFPESDDEDIRISRRALVDLTHRVITRTK
ncbi:solanesyl-diphosphate synthase 1, mitochondrial isoform X1 [Cinnamomum micranthum f. kanehirae]|uniref:Solanesyl-diphosphate synthase 1, mitochondrial isoform X1 n=1 Tax=Cinnamomum micranthum f. kanehirae TaxID=337451 RepID=A0A3S3MTH4_9MAGN|nr:solanesyl-diphosphate synthase 1, mitochondrial isoform X1 [Cinnamomum micranthum f. kanehirae]